MSNKLRRSTSFVAEPAHTKLPPEESEERELLFDIYESACKQKASNDEFSPSKIDAFDPCFFYGGCVANSPESLALSFNNLKTLEVVFDYEMYYQNGANKANAIQQLEETILENLASELALKCYGGVADSSSLQRDQMYRSAGQGSPLSPIVGISSKPDDEVDEHFDECEVPVPAKSTSGATCIPMTGFATLYLNDNPSLDERQMLSIGSRAKRLVRQGMNQNLYISDEVRHVAFIGTRLEEGGAFVSIQDTEPDPLDSGNADPGNNIAAGVVGGVAGLILVGLLVFAVTRGRSGRERASQRDASLQHTPQE